MVNKERWVSFYFGRHAVGKFLRDNKLDLLCRAHTVASKGYEFNFGRKMVTLFSAPNYIGEYNNSGAVMTVDKGMVCSFTVIKPQSDRTPGHRH